jgi:6-phosphofructokinase 1
MVSTGDHLSIEAADLVVRRLGQPAVASPVARLLHGRVSSPHYVHEYDRVLLDDTVEMAAARGSKASALPSLEPGGPREYIYFRPATTRVGIVTCGGLCPGLNNVIRGLVLELAENYGVTDVVGFRDGYRGLVSGEEPMQLTPALVAGIHNRGGTILGTSRGGQDAAAMVTTLTRLGVSVLIVIGGDGTLRGAQEIADEADRRGVTLAVVGVPKTIDNDIPYIDHSFGFQTAFARATDSIKAADTEASVVAEGAGQDLISGDGARDASGNARLADIGGLLRERIGADFAAAGLELSLRYVDPGYAIRSVPANGYDAVYCLRLAQAAVHAAMAGRTAMVVGRWHGRFVHLPISLATGSRNQVDPDGDLWMSVLEATGQPPRFS